MKKSASIVLIATLFNLSLLPAVAGTVSDALDQMDEPKRKQIMQQVIQSSGENCGGVDRMFFKGDNSKENSAYYAVRCKPGGDWMVSIENIGKMKSKVTSCSLMKVVGVECWTPF